MNIEFRVMDKMADQAWADATSSRMALRETVGVVTFNNPNVHEHITAAIAGEITAEEALNRIQDTMRQCIRGWAKDKYINDSRSGSDLGFDENSQYMRRLP